MSTTLPVAQTETRPNYLSVDYGWKSWLFTTDHKRIAQRYLFSITAFFFVGGAFALGVPVNLLPPRGIFAPHRPELHRHDPHDARSGDGLESASVIRVGALCHQPDPSVRNSSHCHYPGVVGTRKNSSCRNLRSGRGRRSGPVSAPVLVLLAS